MTDVRVQLQAALGSAYTIERELGGGGMARVFVALDRALERRVVVKVLPPELAASLSVERFKREIMMVAALQHPHIVGVLSAGEADGLPYFIMPFVDGESLRERVRRGPMPIKDTVSILRDVARALAFAHERGIVHRDIKPDNVLLSAGTATVTDFGVAKAVTSARTPSRFHDGSTLTGAGTSLGTPAYMAPEQAAGDPDTDHRADIYAFGIVAYEMLTGKPPFTGKNPQSLLVAQLTEQPAPVASRRKDVPEALARIVMHCLQKDADDRPQSAGALLQALDDPAVVSGAFSTASREAMAAASTLSRGPLLAIATALVIVAAAAGAWLTRSRDRATAPVPSEPVALTAVAAVNPRSIAVLPLISIGPDSGDLYIAEGITAELTSALGRIQGLRVASRMASSNVRQKGGDIAAIGKDLGVATILEGTVQRDGKRLRLTARLVNVADGLTRWADVFERQATDVFHVQDELTKAVVRALTDELSPSESAAATASATAESHVQLHGTENSAAYNDYLRGRYNLAKRTDGSLRQAASYFQAALKRDNAFALAWAGLADAFALLTVYSPSPSDTLLTTGLAAASRALAIDSVLPEGLASRGNIRVLQGDLAGGERDLKRAVALAPDYAPAHHWYGEFLLRTGRTDDGIAELRKASALDPTSPVIASSLGAVLARTGKADSGLALVTESVEMDPSLPMSRVVRARVLAQAGDRAGAVKDLQTALMLSNGAPQYRGLLARAYAAAGQTDRATAELQKLREVGDKPGAAGAIAFVYLGLKDSAQAMEWLLKAANRKDMIFRMHALGSKEFDAVRNDPRFAELARELGVTTLPAAPGGAPVVPPRPIAPF